VAPSDWMIVHSELERIWKEEFMAQFKVLSISFREGTDEYHEILSHNSVRPNRDSSLTPPDYRSRNVTA
jgi:hypothetical protein